MKKILILLLLLSFVFSCNENIDFNKESQLNFTYYKKDLKNNFKKLLDLNPATHSTLNTKSLESGNESANLTDDDKLILEFWNDITDDERKYIIENFDNLDLSVKYSISTGSNNFEIKFANDTSTTTDDDFVAQLSFNQFLNDKFSSILVPFGVARKYCDIDDLSSEFFANSISASDFIKMLIQNNKTDEIESFLYDIKSPISYDEFENEYEKALGNQLQFNDALETKGSSASSKNYNELCSYLGDKLKDGDILLKKGDGKAYGIAGEWSHGGIFSKSLYDFSIKDAKVKANSIHCIYSAQPNDTSSLPDDMKPDRPGYACLDTINQYNKSYSCAVVRPHSYTAEKARKAVNYAKSIYYDKKAKYDFPWWEIICFGNTSHDLKNTHTYCTKVAYTAWKKVGVDLDGDVFAGNVVTPDDIYSSTYSHTTQILFWKKKHNAVSNAMVFEQSNSSSIGASRRIRDDFSNN